MKHALWLCLAAACGGPSTPPDAGGCPVLDSAVLDSGCADPSQAPSYQNQVLPIMETECLPCHTRGHTPFSGVDLSTWQGANAYHGLMLYDLDICRMPNGDGGPNFFLDGGVPPIRDADKLTIMDWCACGAPQN